MFEALIDKIKNAEKIAVFNHLNPDGDAMGSAYGLKLVLEAAGKRAEVFLRDGEEYSKEYRCLKGTEPSKLSMEECDLKIAVDCADLERLGTYKAVFRGNTAAIDHHITHKAFADVTVVVADASSTGEIIFDLAAELRVIPTKEIANNLYMAIMSDTGSFKYSSTTPKTHIAAAKLMETGIDAAQLSKTLFDTKSVEFLTLYKKGIEGLELHCEGRLAILYFSEADFKEAGISENDADAVVNLPNSIEGVEVGVYIRQRGEVLKVSLRSSGFVDVARIAEAFDGGGHSNASGFSLKQPIEEAKRIIVGAISQVLEKKEYGRNNKCK